ncbi:MAG: 50S ribosomal protein L20 [Vicinamibacterales bacterium]
MPRVKRGTVRRAKRKKLEKLTKGFFQNKSKLYKFMKEAAEKAGVYAYAGRKQKRLPQPLGAAHQRRGPRARHVIHARVRPTG